MEEFAKITDATKQAAKKAEIDKYAADIEKYKAKKVEAEAKVKRLAD